MQLALPSYRHLLSLLGLGCRPRCHRGFHWSYCPSSWVRFDDTFCYDIDYMVDTTSSRRLECSRRCAQADQSKPEFVWEHSLTNMEAQVKNIKGRLHRRQYISSTERVEGRARLTDYTTPRTHCCNGDHEGSDIQLRSPSPDEDSGICGRGRAPMQVSSVADHASGNTPRTRGISRQSPSR
jgi:hypothetical protein